MLKAGENVFVAFSRQLPLEYMGLAMEVIGELNLVPFVFHGLSAPPAGKAASTYTEAIGDLYKSRLVYLCIAGATDIQEEGVFVEEIPAIKKCGIRMRLCLVGSADKNSDVAYFEAMQIFDSIPIIVSASLDEFGKGLRKDLLASMTEGWNC